ncbi:hypothetical protein F5884DRAFT_902333 [Xylogone sp. PMI_703]|nr:hypothetical protein F5884DRAFT_902333 [Xylogone sp. PMI_703]
MAPPSGDMSTAGPSREMSVLTAASGFSTDRETSESWPLLAGLARKRINQYVPASRGGFETKVTSCLLAFIKYLPEGRRELCAREVLKSNDDDELYEHFANLCTGLLYPMKANSARGTITPSPYEQRWENGEQILATLFDPNSHDSEFRQTLLRRDNFRCVISDHMDINRWKELGKPSGVKHTDVHGAHLIPFRFGKWKDTKIKTYDDFSSDYEIFLPADNLVTLHKALDAEDIRLPNLAYIDCHYRIEEILHASGMGDAIEQKLRDWEDLKEMGHGSMKEDGPTDVSQYLTTALWQPVMG